MRCWISTRRGQGVIGDARFQVFVTITWISPFPGEVGLAGDCGLLSAFVLPFFPPFSAFSIAFFAFFAAFISSFLSTALPLFAALLSTSRCSSLTFTELVTVVCAPPLSAPVEIVTFTSVVDLLALWKWKSIKTRFNCWHSAIVNNFYLFSSEDLRVAKLLFRSVKKEFSSPRCTADSTAFKNSWMGKVHFCVRSCESEIACVTQTDISI